MDDKKFEITKETLIKGIDCAKENDLVGFFDKMIKIGLIDEADDEQINEVYPLLSDFIEQAEKIDGLDGRIYIYIMTFMTFIKKKREDLIKLCDWTITSGIYPQFKYWIFLQVSAWIFNYHDYFNGQDVYVANTLLLRNIVDEVALQMPDGLLEPIPSTERDDSFVLVIALQMLSEHHGPTKTALDRCAAIMNGLKKKVLLICTAENGNKMIKCPIYHSQTFNYKDDLKESDHIEWKGITIPYFQCEDKQLDIQIVQMILEIARKYKPGLVVEIGTGSIVASLIDRMIPVLSVSLTNEGESSVTSCKTIYRDYAKNELEALHRVGQDEKNLLKSVFSFSLKSRTIKLERDDIGLPNGVFAIVIIGARLDVEIDDEMVKLMDEVSDNHTYFVIIGDFINRELFDPYTYLSQNMIFCGKVDDTRACFEICDLYLNPRRMGGGTSAVEAMDVGIPIVTYNFGDVGVNAGDDFVCETREEMIELINRYKTDLVFYGKQSIKAKQRATYLQNSELHFCDAIKKFKDRFD